MNSVRRVLVVSLAIVHVALCIQWSGKNDGKKGPNYGMFDKDAHGKKEKKGGNPAQRSAAGAGAPGGNVGGSGNNTGNNTGNSAGKSIDEKARSEGVPHEKGNPSQKGGQKNGPREGPGEPSKEGQKERGREGQKEPTKEGAPPSTGSAPAGSTPSSMGAQDIESGLSAVTAISNHYDSIRKRENDFAGTIGKILIYKDGDVFRDYWGKLKFTYQDGRYVDEKGYFEGVAVKDREEIMERGVLTDIGFFQDGSISSEEVNNQYITMKMIMDEIASSSHLSMDDLQKEKMDVSTVTRLVESIKKVGKGALHRWLHASQSACARTRCAQSRARAFGAWSRST